MGFSSTPSQKQIIAFVHIEKAAGTTLIHLLRNNFVLRYCDVKPLSKASNRLFMAQDMKTVLKFNPFVKCIGGHGVKPFSDLENHFPRIRYITLLRSPIERYLSHFQYWREQLGYQLSFQDFLTETRLHNFQTKKIAGDDDLCRAKQMVGENFFLVGLVEAFDEFILLFKKKLLPFIFIPDYERKNVAYRHSPLRKTLDNEFHIFRSEIIKNNQNDIALYEYVKSTLMPKEKEIYGPIFQKDLEKLKNPVSRKLRRHRAYIDYIVRKLYYEPIFNTIRKRQQL